MVRNTIAFGIALGALLAVSGMAGAADPTPAKSGFSGGAVGGGTTNLMGKGTAVTAAKAGDTEQTWYHGYRRGFYRGFYGGLGYPFGFAAPYAVGYPYVGGYYNPYYIAPAVGVYGRIGPVAVGIGINGGASDLAAPAVSLNRAGTAAPPAQRPLPVTPGVAPQPGGVYDGGPANPVPIPKQDPNGASGQVVPALPSPGLPVSLPKTPTTPAKPYTYKGYGDK